MQINNSNKFSPNYKAKIFLNDKTLLKGTGSYYQNTPFDVMFNENSVVKALNSTSEFIKNNILCKYFRYPTNKLTQIIAYLQYKLVTNLRKYADRVFLRDNHREIYLINKFLDELNITAPEYIEEIAKIGNNVQNKYIIANTEDKVLEKLTDTNEATIFVLNHPNYHKDKFIYAIVNSMLSKLYVKNGQQHECPRPKILVSRNIINIINKAVLNIYKTLGLTLVDASNERKDSLFNVKSMKPIIEEFTKDKLNLFIFPEGNNSVYKDRPLEEKIQRGIADLIRICTAIKARVRVVPIGITYTKEKNNLGKIFIGQPLIFSKENCSDKDAGQNILKIICENLKFCVDKSKTIHSPF